MFQFIVDSIDAWTPFLYNFSHRRARRHADGSDLVLPRNVGKIIDVTEDHRSASFNKDIQVGFDSLELFMEDRKTSKLIQNNRIKYSDDDNEDLITKVQDIVESCYDLKKMKRKRSNTEGYEHESFSFLRGYIEDFMKQFTTYFIVDHKKIIEIMINNL